MSTNGDGRGSRGRRYRRHTEEFKREAVALVRARRAEGVSQTQVARELDVDRCMLRRWEQHLRGGAPSGAGEGETETPEQEVRRLRRENAVLRQERDFAKKVAAYFATESH